ncbi:PREDICTED: uncharacterized protein LOC105360553 [Ceratosolen solmsi marchali]|uniref:Uncharacterized protein LOC105360553 n=1 Tax=Ceratosolen solmsi marchali TaxID=326594 RepID=A0AAJ6VM57_9HYME|nr:PREDICTED: uncharacterized protein LOC105360553 [Ceratosolen solmsi marchali]
MFRAISFIVWGTENRHRYLRSLVVRHIENSWRELKPFVVAEWSMSSLDDYIGFMGADGTFASELECVVATKLNRLNLAIYRRVEGSDALRRILYSQYSGSARTANLLFSGHNEYGHYDVLEPVGSASPSFVSSYLP